jgi:hypothetical protein
MIDLIHFKKAYLPILDKTKIGIIYLNIFLILI